MIWDMDGLLLSSTLPILLLIVILDLFPVRLLSGEEYSGSLAGYLILLLAYGPTTALAGVALSTIVSHWRKANFHWRNINGFRVLSAQGKLTICLYAAHRVMEWMDNDSGSHVLLYTQVAVGTLVFSLLYIALAAGVSRTISGIPLRNNLMIKLKELAVPVVLCTVIVPHFLHHLSLGYMVYETVYILLFLLLIVFFSYGYIQQVQLRRRGTEEFIRIGELRIMNQAEGHGRNVGMICEQILEQFGYPKKKRPELANIAALHDIGKMLLPLDILTKRGALSLSEQQEYESHPLKGAEIVGNITGDKKAATWILHHHERYDGKGFPDGLQGANIPYESRIIYLCSQLEYLLRQYASDEDVLHQLEKMAGKELDPQLVRLVHRDTIAELRQHTLYKQAEMSAELEYVIRPDETMRPELTSITGGTRLLKYDENGKLSGAGLQDIPEVIVHAAEGLAERALLMAESFYEVLTGEDYTFEAYFYPEHTRVMVVLTDITPALQYREELHYNTLSSYRDVIRTLSQSKMDICLQQQEIESQLGERVAGMDIRTRADVSTSRTLVVEQVPDLLRQQFPKKLMSIKLAVSEGVTNLIKHAQQGKIEVFRKSGSLQIYITDHGSGIPLHELPKTILVSGYSSKSSLGKGFALMYVSADRVMLHTSPEGTAILLEFYLSAEEAG
ncbi:HD domain-containing phosphohydrolase [Paenibacillus kandeliae]|uniref:HD domain-containing phosphohydrolase n=1 Tax=Paenibacillus kandeliae TaxID=3231269 RepID=UPI00345973E5